MDREDLQLRYTINYKADSNYDYWHTRAKFEQTPDALAAREVMFARSQTFREGDLFAARKLYEDGFAKWRQVIDAFPESIDETNRPRATTDSLHSAVSQRARPDGRGAGRRRSRSGT